MIMGILNLFMFIKPELLTRKMYKNYIKIGCISNEELANWKILSTNALNKFKEKVD